MGEEDVRIQLAGCWRGVYDHNRLDSFVKLEIYQQQSTWYMCFRDRHYRESPEAALTFSNGSKLSFSATFPHWIMATIVALSGTLTTDGILVINVRGQGMTGLDEHSCNMTKDGAQFAAFETPCNGPPGTDRPTPDKLMTEILTSYSGSDREPLVPRIESLLVTKNGTETLLEEYLWGMTPDTMHLISSCTKSLTAILAGIAIDQGLFRVEDGVAEYFPWITSTTWRDEPQITVHHVLSMTAGLAHSGADSQALLASSDIEAFCLLRAKRVSDPGTKYHYDNSLPCLIGCLIERTSGMTLDQFADKYLFEPLQIRQRSWTYTSASTSLNTPPSLDSPRVMASGGLSMTLRDFSKVGTLLLDKGMYNGHRIVSQEFLAAATSQQTPMTEYPYGYYFHLNTSQGQQPWLNNFDGYMALGQGEQFLAVSPKDRIVISVFSSTWHKEQSDTASKTQGSREEKSLPAAWNRASERNPSGRNWAAFECFNKLGIASVLQDSRMSRVGE